MNTHDRNAWPATVAVLLTHRPPRISMLFLGLAGAAHWLLPGVRAEILATPWPLAIAVGLAGFAVMIWAWWLFREAQTAICPAARESALVTHGVYRLTRNPMYLGIVLMMLAVALWFGTLPFYLVTAVYWLVMDRVFCPFEERKLEAAFGDAFRAYRESVRRWI